MGRQLPVFQSAYSVSKMKPGSMINTDDTDQKSQNLLPSDQMLAAPEPTI
jgi:hypothetical protein